jgi:hypothetical protein
MIDPTTGRTPLTPREAIAVALLVWGCAFLGDLAIQFAFILPVAGLEVVGGSELFLVAAGVVVLVVLLRNRLADRLTAKEPPAEWQLGSQQIQLVAIQCVGVCLAASGLERVQWREAGAHAARLERCLQLGPHVAVSSEAVAGFAIGMLLTFAARPLNAWLVRDHRRQASHQESS